LIGSGAGTLWRRHFRYASIKKEEPDMRTAIVAALMFFLGVTAGCAGNPMSSQADQCESGLRAAYKELDFAKAAGFSGTVEYSKAVGLLTAAKVQQEFGKYPNCIDKVRRARAYILKSREAK
jgi:hypothetical protein